MNRKTIWSQSGQSLVELAFVLPALLLLTLGVIEIGRYAYTNILLGNAARAGAAYGGQSAPQSADLPGICRAASGDYQTGTSPASCTYVNSGATVSPTGTKSTLNVNASTLCTCDSNGTFIPDPPTMAQCNPAITPTAGTCSSGHWTIEISVNVSNSYAPLFLQSLTTTISKTATMRVIQ